MVFVEITCPNCHNLRPVNVSHIGYYKSKGTGRAGSTQVINPNDVFDSYVCALCTSCGQPLMIVLEIIRKDHEHAKKCINSPEQFRIHPKKFISVYPEADKPYSHSSLPEELKDLFIDLQHILKEGKQPSIVVAGCRSVVEAALNNLGAKGKTIIKKIDNLKEKGIITPLLADWAHRIRLEGNKSIHEIKAQENDAKEIVEFTKIFLQYTFELPARIPAQNISE